MGCAARFGAVLGLLGLFGCSSSSTATDGPADAATSVDATTPAAVDAGAASDAGRDVDAADARDAAPPIGDAGPPLDASAFETPGADATIVAFDGTLVCFGTGGTGPCSRTVDAPVTFPATGAYQQIALNLTLDCPSNGCDPWDRAGSIALVEPAAEDGGAETLIEIARFMTPYGITSGVNAPPTWTVDVTELRPLLAGTVTLRVFIDTWVPQGNAAAYGGGWVVGATFAMTGGVATKNPVYATPIWPWKTTNREPTEVVYGDEGDPISKSLPTQTLTPPTGPTSWGIRSVITGHGQANLDNCSEFCSRDHSWAIDDGAPNATTVWRTDCANYPSQGTYQYSRAGWCPGASVTPWDLDVTSQITPGRPSRFTYGVDAYVNTCNAGAPDGGLCTGCASGESCAYDGSDHTQPFYYVSSVLVGFE